MNQHKFAFSFAWIAALLVAAPATAQLLNHPVTALPAGNALGATFVTGQYARGLNDNSGKLNSFGVGVGRAMQRVSFSGMGSYTATALDELSLAAAVGVHLLSDDSTPVQLTIQSGLGWWSADISATESQTMLNFPIGIAIQARPGDAATSVRPWVMPRLNIARSGGTTTAASSTQTDFAVSGGVSVTGQSGAGAQVSFDWVNVEGGSPFGFSIGVHYAIN